MFMGCDVPAGALLEDVVSISTDEDRAASFELSIPSRLDPLLDIEPQVEHRAARLRDGLPKFFAVVEDLHWLAEATPSPRTRLRSNAAKLVVAAALAQTGHVADAERLVDDAIKLGSLPLLKRVARGILERTRVRIVDPFDARLATGQSSA
ncbi:MAG: hypothetical protein AAF416_21550 [Pseudomonadota bacterium]